MKTILVISFFLFSCFSYSQTVVGDSMIVLTPQEAQVLVKMTEELKYTKKELSASDSIISHQKNVINTQEKIISEEESYINFQKKDNKKKVIISGLVGVIIGLVGGILL